MEREQLRKLRQKMKEAGISVYVIPSSDCHESEYVCAHYRARGIYNRIYRVRRYGGGYADRRRACGRTAGILSRRSVSWQGAGSGCSGWASRECRNREPGWKPGWTRADVLDLTDVPWELPGRRAWRKQPEERARN